MRRRNLMYIGMISALLSGCVSDAELYSVAQNDVVVSTAGGIESLLNNPVSDGSVVIDKQNTNGIPNRLIKEPVYTSDIGNGPESLHFLDVGSGMCSLAVDKGHVIMINTGTEASRKKVMTYLASLSPNKIDIVITNMNTGYADNLVEILDKYHDIIGDIIIPPYNSAKPDMCNNILSAVSQYELMVSTPLDYTKFALGNTTAVVYRPYTDIPYSHSSAETVFSLYFNGYQYVFEGNIGEVKEKSLIKYHNFDTQTPTAAVFINSSGDNSHGSWLSDISPVYCVLSGSSSKSMRSRVSKLGINLLSTDANGTLVFSYTDEENLNVITKVNDVDKEGDYETTAPDLNFVDKNIYIDDSMNIHSLVNCDNFAGVTIRSMLLSKALDKDYGVCPKCMNKNTREDYQKWLNYNGE